MNTAVKQCPFCAEEILEAAKKCKHCGSDLDKTTSVSTTATKAAADYGLFLLIIPVISTLLIWFWISGMNLLQSPGSTLDFITIATVLVTAIVAAMEASKVGMKSDKKLGTYGPTAWFFIIALIWIVGYPVYLFKRKHYGLANRLMPALLVTVVFLGSVMIMNSAIDQKVQELQGTLQQLQNP